MLFITDGWFPWHWNVAPVVARRFTLSQWLHHRYAEAIEIYFSLQAGWRCEANTALAGAWLRLGPNNTDPDSGCNSNLIWKNGLITITWSTAKNCSLIDSGKIWPLCFQNKNTCVETWDPRLLNRKVQRLKDISQWMYSCVLYWFAIQGPWGVLEGYVVHIHIAFKGALAMSKKIVTLHNFVAFNSNY